MAPVQLKQIESLLRREFSDLVDISDYQKKSPDERETALLTRSLGALTLTRLADIDNENAVKFFTDGYKDLGIDCIYYDDTSKILHLIQTKWIKSGKGGPDTKDVTAFANGVDSVLQQNFENANDKIINLTLTISKALDDINLAVHLHLVYTGDYIHNDVKSILEDKRDKLNEVSQLVSTNFISIKDIFKLAQRDATEETVDFDLAILEFGQIREPYQGFYGQVAASDLGQLWNDFGTNLLSKNIRKFLGDNTVNEDVQATLRTRPEAFVYLNNGITIICNSIKKKPIGGANRAMGIFTIERGSVVNGAQTIGNIGKIFKENQDLLIGASVQVKVIALDQAPPDFASEITKSANTQTRIERRDFVSLDPRQVKLKADLFMLGVQYIYKTGDTPSVKSNSITLEEATSALACANKNLNYAINSKKEIRQALGRFEKSALYRPIFSQYFRKLYQ